jgi:hypothetical protein
VGGVGVSGVTRHSLATGGMKKIKDKREKTKVGRLKEKGKKREVK